MKTIIITFLVFVLLFVINCCLMAQVNVQNNGIVYISNSSDILFINGSFTNASGAAFTNNGNFYLKQDLTNNEASMATGTGTLYLNGTSGQTVSGTEPFKTYNLITNNSTGFTLNNNLSVSAAHTYSAGLIVTSATPNYLVYESGSSYSGDNDSKHVNGWVKKLGSTDFVFPVGNGTYERTIALTNLTSSSEFNAKHYDGPTPNPNNLFSPLVLIDEDEYWGINKVSGGSANVVMNWDNAKIPVPQVLITNLRAAYYNGSNLWASIGGSATGNITTTGSITSNSVSSFNNNFTFGSTAWLLPISILNFTGNRNGTYNRLKWTIGNELNVHHYELQRSNDGLNFTSINTQAAKNSNGTELYTYDDVAAMQSKVYYRLRSTATDGAITYSGIILIALSPGLSKEFYVIKNPVADKIDIYAGDIYKGTYTYTIANSAGQIVQSGKLNITNPGIQTIALRSRLSTGIYMLVVRNAENVLQKNILKE
jgi:hypothetical protein